MRQHEKIWQKAFCNSWSHSCWFCNFLLQLYEFHNWKEHLLNSQNANFWTRMQKLEGFVLEWKNFAVQKPFPLLITTEESCWHVIIEDRRRSGKILERIEHCFKTCKVTRACFKLIGFENHWNRTAGQSMFFPVQILLLLFLQPKFIIFIHLLNQFLLSYQCVFEKYSTIFFLWRSSVQGPTSHPSACHLNRDLGAPFIYLLLRKVPLSHTLRTLNPFS